MLLLLLLPRTATTTATCTSMPTCTSSSAVLARMPRDCTDAELDFCPVVLLCQDAALGLGGLVAQYFTEEALPDETLCKLLVFLLTA